MKLKKSIIVVASHLETVVACRPNVGFDNKGRNFHFDACSFILREKQSYAFRFFFSCLDQSLFVAHYMVRFFFFFFPWDPVPRSVQALGLSVLSESLKASVAVELELGCMTPAATSSSLLLPSLFRCWRRCKFSARPPVLYFFFFPCSFASSSFFFFF